MTTEILETTERVNSFYEEMLNFTKAHEEVYKTDFFVQMKHSVLDGNEIDEQKLDLIAIDTLSNKKALFAYDKDKKELFKVKDSPGVQLFPNEEKKTTVAKFESHKNFFPVLTTERSGSIIGSVVKLKTGEFATITSQGVIITD